MRERINPPTTPRPAVGGHAINLPRGRRGAPPKDPRVQAALQTLAASDAGKAATVQRLTGQGPYSTQNDAVKAAPTISIPQMQQRPGAAATVNGQAPAPGTKNYPR